jgi:hypothetical protein
VSGEQPPPPGGGEPPAPPPGWSQSPAPTPGWGRPAPRPGSEPGPDEETPRWLQSHGSPAPYVSPYPVGAPGPPGWQPTGLPGAAHRPGAIPLRPLVLGDILDGAFRIIRYNPRATVGAAVLVSAVAMVLPVVVGIITGSSDGLRFEPGSDGLSDGQVAGLVTTFGSLLLAYQLQAIGLLFVSGGERRRARRWPHRPPNRSRRSAAPRGRTSRPGGSPARRRPARGSPRRRCGPPTPRAGWG